MMIADQKTTDVSPQNESPEALLNRPGFAKRDDSYLGQVLKNHAIRKTHQTPDQMTVMKAVNYLHIPEGPRHLLNQLVTHVNYKHAPGEDTAASRFMVYPGNLYLTIALGKNERTVQRYALQLEELGLITRCYNALNSRVGFDLSGFIAAARTICDDFEADVASLRKSIRDQRQLELMLGDLPAQAATARPDRNDMRPTTLSPRDDNLVTQNSKNRTNIESSLCSGILALVDIATFARHSGVVHIEPASAAGDITAQCVLGITRLMQNTAGTATAPWRNAVLAVGQEYATALWLTAELDPFRKGAIAQYFAWLAKHLNCPTKSGMITAAIARAQSAIARKTTPAGHSQPSAARPADNNPTGAPMANSHSTPPTDAATPSPAPCKAQDAADTLADRLCATVSTNLGKMIRSAKAVSQIGATLYIKAETQFAASYLESNYLKELAVAATKLSPVITSIKIIRPDQHVPADNEPVADPSEGTRGVNLADASHVTPDDQPIDNQNARPADPDGARLVEHAHGALAMRLRAASHIVRIEDTLYIKAKNHFDSCALRANYLDDIRKLIEKLGLGIERIKILKMAENIPASTPCKTDSDHFARSVRAKVPADCAAIADRSQIAKINEVVTITLPAGEIIAPAQRSSIIRAVTDLAGPVLVTIA